MKLRPVAVWKTVTEGVAAAAFALMFAAFIVQVASRYVFNAPLAWTLELCSIAYVWVVFWSCGLLVPERRQIVFDVIYHAFRPGPRRWIAIANTAAMALLFLAAFPAVLEYAWFLRRRNSMMLQVPMSIVYSCFVVFMAAVIIGGAIRVRRLLGAAWREEL